ncbi:tetratricopeptide repeat protein [Glaciimonas soli]|nr:winged helix-turn-helix domain-containing protein [Glaciimonas soli]
MSRSFDHACNMDPVSAGFKIEENGFISHKDALLYLPSKEQGAFRLLLRAWPKAVAKDDFARDVWAGRMSDESLARCISQLRRALSAISGIQINAIYGRGYSLTIPQPVVNAPEISRQSLQSEVVDTRKTSFLLEETSIYARQFIEQRSPEAIDHAESIARNIISQTPDCTSSKLVLAECIANRINYGMEVKVSLIDDCLELLESVEQIAPQTPGLASRMGHLLDYKWDFDQARLRHEQALHISSGDASTHLYYGLHLLATGNSSEAIVAFRRALELNPFSSYVAVMLASATALASEDPADIVAQARSTFLAYPEDPKTYLYLLFVLARINPQPEVAHGARHLMADRSSWGRSPGMLSYILARCGDRAGALEFIAMNSMGNTAIRTKHSAALIALGQVDEAMTLVKETVSLGCGSLPTLMNAFETTVLRRHPEYPAVHARIFARMPTSTAKLHA